MTRMFPLAPIGAALLAIGIGSGPAAEAGDRFARSVVPGAFPAAPTGAVAVLPGAAIPPTAARSPYLGTFRPDPRLILRSGFNTGGGYAPADLPVDYASMSLYGPFSRLRSLPTEVVTYSRGYDGVLRPTSTGIAYDYPDPRRYRDTTLITPTTLRINPVTGGRVPSGFGRYVLGQH